MSEQPVDLPAIDTDPEAGLDHPNEVGPEQAVLGQVLYEAIDDLDDESNGIDR
jgi:hypothetical protein